MRLELAGAPRRQAARRGYIDWLRGLAVLIMIEAHTVDAWTLLLDRTTPIFRWAMVVGGFGAPLFLFLAGVAVALSAAAKERKTADASRAAAAVRRRGWEIFGLAFLFRLQALIINQGSPGGLLKVDILNVMGPSIVIAAWLWQVGRTTRGRVIAGLLATIAFAMMTPIVRATPLLTPLPDPIEWYLRPYPGRTNFTMFPWAAFVFSGLIAGSLLEGTSEARERRVHVWLAAVAALTTAASYGSSFLPSIYTASSFWTSSPTFLFMRVGLLTLVLPLAYLWERRPTGRRWSPMQQFGRTSLFIYWIHVEMVYGWLSQPLHRALPIGWVFGAFAVFTGFLFGVSLLKTWIVRRWNERRSAAPMGARAETDSPQRT
ncbi:MAG: DUF1624 domain-containing protein [Acidobacteria bacterium]|nr:DUF1624 domain-containing protein [Acidobacteriota bacterium]